MEKYDFETVTDRHNTESIKWDCSEDILPRWIADRDYKVAPEIVSALEKRVLHPVYGYTEPHDNWYHAYRDFFERRHKIKLEKDWLLFSLGVVPTISSSVRKLTKEGDNVVLLTPVYNIFYNSVLNNHRVVKEVPLLLKDGNYSIDFPALEDALKDDKTTRRILCNPANPVGRIWTKEELSEIGRLCYENHVVVLSDEIHGEIVRPGRTYNPFFAVNEINKNISVNAISVTKPFNLAGIHTSAIIVPNEDLRKKVNRQINTDEVAEPNIFSCPAAIAALSEGEEWLDERREHVFYNRDYVSSFVEKNIAGRKVVPGDATYLVWIDIRKITKDSLIFAKFLKQETGLWLQDGSVYGKGGEGFLRRNVATPLSLLKNGLKRLEKGTKAFKERALNTL